jgi:hypothetical protein
MCVSHYLCSKKSKKAKRDAGPITGVVPTNGTFHYHPEEEFLEKVRRQKLGGRLIHKEKR